MVAANKHIGTERVESGNFKSLTGRLLANTGTLNTHLAYVTQAYVAAW